MFEQLNNYFHILIPYFPLGIIGIYRWSIWSVKKIISTRYKPIPENNYTNTLSIVVPVYNEDINLFKRALESWKQNNPNEIIAVIDYTDTDCINEFKKFQLENQEFCKLIITEKPGKREALSDGIKIAEYNIIALVDSDTIWEPNIKNTLLAPFEDPEVGGVGPRQDVLKIDTLARKLFNIHIDHRYYDEMTYLATVADGLTCISGRTALYRAAAIKSLTDSLDNETFLGTKCISGDDKCLTRLVQQDGWKVRYQNNALVLTPGSADLLTLLKQQIRWTRNTYRSDLISLSSKWIWKREKFLAFHMLDRFTQPFTLVLGPIYFIFSIIWGHWLVAGILLLWWHFSRGIKLYPHLRNNPSSILILPIYIITTYLLAVLKIYAMVTIRQQGWITRWDKSRLQSVGGRFWRTITSLIPYIITGSILLLLSFSVVSYKKIVTTDNNKTSNNIIFSDTSDLDVNHLKQNILDKVTSSQIKYYEIKKGETLSSIARKYNINLSAIINANNGLISNPNSVKEGQKIIIPISELKNSLDKETLLSRKNREIILDESENTLTIQGENNIVTFNEIYENLKNKNVIEKLENKEWLLKVNLFIKDGATLIIDRDDVSWLKLKSDEDDFVWIISFGGSILIKDTKITSWDEKESNYDNTNNDGRSFILAKHDGRMDIINSELAFLGYKGNNKHKNVISDLYSVSWEIPDNTFEQKLITGKVINSAFHDNYFGAYTFGATGMIFENNEFYNNIQHGLNIHNNSNNFTVKNNIARNNGGNGIIVSRDCLNHTIKNNVFSNNKLHGIIFHSGSDNNIVENNDIYKNIDGVAIYDSHSNLILNNNFYENKNSIRANYGSSKNYIEQNNITKNTNGIFIYDQANNNIIINNSVKNNEKGVYIKNANENIIKDSLTEGDNKIEIKLTNSADDNIIQEF
ncbi:glycosyltransferase [Candidatus Falkowbacteria bacterium]|jgi:parallel beta-helix repeat protein|nr:glycosyltransferase [Candidatus Falkowbacteria bacterium]MBT4433491.1 glycosyltransferase [Candidatus Falkowbacteria bacterium]